MSMTFAHVGLDVYMCVCVFESVHVCMYTSVGREVLYRKGLEANFQCL